MTQCEAADLLRDAVSGRAGVWADMGAGGGTFTRALAGLLESHSRVIAVDRDPRAIASLRKWAAGVAPEVVALQGDFTKALCLPGVGHEELDGLLFANALHFARHAPSVLASLVVPWLRPGGRVVLVEYDGRSPSRWVPYPISTGQWPELAERAGLSHPVVTARRPSAYGGDLYVAVADRPRDG